VSEGPAPESAERDEEEHHEPRVRIIKGSPWRIDPKRREKWSSPEYVRDHAVEIRQVGDPVLHRAANKPKMPKTELEALVARMFASMVAANGIGIAAPQIGVPLRIAIMDVDASGIVAIDPRIVDVSEEVEETSEGCLSVRGFYGMIERPVGARLEAMDLNGKRFAIEGDDLGAQCMLHEADHLSGTLYIDRLRSREDLHAVRPDETEEVGA
jgi:peptide deformylase